MNISVEQNTINFQSHNETLSVKKETLFNQIVSEYQEKIYRICYGYLYDKEYAQDCFQEILINIWKSLDKFRNESALSTYLYRIAVNTTISFNKKQKSKWKRTEEINTNTFEPTGKEEESEQLLKLRKAISELENEQKILITMVLEGISNKEIAEIVGMTPNNVGVKIHRIKQALTAKLNQQ